MRGAMLLWLVAHFSMSALYVLPPTPLRISLDSTLNQTIGRYFAQNWSLFAPTPISSNIALIVRPLDAGEVQAALAGSCPTGGWYDVSTPAWHESQRQRFSAYDRLVRPQSNVVRAFMGGIPRALFWKAACERGDSAACREYSRILLGTRVQSAPLLQRIASSACLSISSGKRLPVGVAVRVRITDAVPWSKRVGGRQPTADFDLGVFPITRDVVPSPVVRAEAKEAAL